MQPPEAAARGALQLLDALDPSAGAGAGGAPPTMPAGFLEDFGARFGDEGLEGVAGPIGERRQQQGLRYTLMCWQGWRWGCHACAG